MILKQIFALIDIVRIFLEFLPLICKKHLGGIFEFN